ncbi:unnamed protein product [Staurois parvus]|uniref:Secreted protein n=1 Tax=Staurois parvus TaxID=386267 RepID=A0ABN9EIC2_9NEOB|nr:unnamed protein product [Staurois parvus]
MRLPDSFLCGLPLCGSVAVVISCFHFVIIPPTVNRGIFSSKKISQMDLLHRWQPTTLEFTELLRATHYFTNVCRSSLHA